jgi:hypothetical protein
VVWEIMEPIDEPTIMQEFLDEHGEGIHQVTFDDAGAPWESRLAVFSSRPCDRAVEDIRTGIHWQRAARSAVAMPLACRVPGS